MSKPRRLFIPGLVTICLVLSAGLLVVLAGCGHRSITPADQKPATRSSTTTTETSATAPGGNVVNGAHDEKQVLPGARRSKP